MRISFSVLILVLAATGWIVSRAGAAGEPSPGGPEAVARATLKETLGAVRQARANFGFTATEDLEALSIETPGIPSTTFDLEKLGGSEPLADPAALLKPDAGWWFVVTLQGKARGIVAVVRSKEGDRWLGESFGRAELARSLDLFRRTGPAAGHPLRIVHAPSTPDVYLTVGGLKYPCLFPLPADAEVAGRFAAAPPRAVPVLESVRANWQAQAQGLSPFSPIHP